MTRAAYTRKKTILDQPVPVRLSLPVWMVEQLDSKREIGKLNDQIRAALVSHFELVSPDGR